ncbi:hypothetical protein LRP76_01400 [Burkholderia pseudomallei]|uniref:hypothetical protein n=1 Tax=Burkholderia pseudomallei TaxID=28450 RepID=UPI001E3DDD55|nr:hypothetical protein [Burkholderia pseudomallei]
MADEKLADRLARVKKHAEEYNSPGFEAWVVRAREKDAEAVRDVLAALVLQLRDLSFPSSSVSLDLARFAADAFAAYLDGEQPTLDAAFGVKVDGRQRRSSNRTERNERIAMRIFQLREVEPRRTGGAAPTWDEVCDVIEREERLEKPLDSKELRRLFGVYRGEIVQKMAARLTVRMASDDC